MGNWAIDKILANIVANAAKALDVSLGITKDEKNITDVDNFKDSVKDKVQDFTNIDIERSYERNERIARDVKGIYDENYQKELEYFRKNEARMNEKDRKEKRHEEDMKMLKYAIIWIAVVAFLFIVF